MLSKIFLLFALIFLGQQAYGWLMQIDINVLRDVSTSILIALILQPFVIHQFR